MSGELRDWATSLKPWLAPSVIGGVVVLAVSWQVNQTNSRFDFLDRQYADIGQRLTNLDAKSDRRIDALAQSASAILTQQAAMSSQLGRAEAQLAYIQGRIDKIAQKLEIASADELKFNSIPSPGGTTSKDNSGGYPQVAPTRGEKGQPQFAPSGQFPALRQ